MTTKKAKRRQYGAFVRRVKDFIAVYKNSKLGMAGAIMLFLFIFFAIAAPLLTPYEPIKDTYLADSVAMPLWMIMVPEYKNAPRTTENKFNASDWTIDESSLNSNYFEVMQKNDRLIVQFPKVIDVLKENETHELMMVVNFDYPYDPPSTFNIKFELKTTIIGEADYAIDLFLKTPSGINYNFWNIEGMNQGNASIKAVIDSRDIPLKMRLGLDPLSNLAKTIFSEKGEYELVFKISSGQLNKGDECRLDFSKINLKILGEVHGLLGTDHVGSDIFSQLIYGTRISLLIGILAALLSISIGLLVGLIAGYYGSFVDETLMRIVDILLSIPGLALLMVLVTFLGKNIWNIILLLGILGWMGFARASRSQVLSLKERTFVEASRALGASNKRIMFRQILPNVMPLVFATLVLSIPGAILTESALSFLGLGDPRISSWGRILYNAYSFGGFSKLAWWWILPPGLAITILSLSFVFIGHALDEILNPRLRKR